MEEEKEYREENEQMLENITQGPSPTQNGDLIEEKLRALVKNDEGDFCAWTSLISEIEKTSPNDIESIRKIYEAFLLEFPLCYGYWKKYANHVAYYCNLNEVEKVYERAVEAIPYSVDLWVSYCCFGMLAYEDPADVQRLFERGLSFVGKDYSSHLLWDKYIEFEYSQKQWSRLAYVYINTLRFPSKKLNNYYTSFKKLVEIWEEELGYEKDITVKTGSGCEKTGEKPSVHAEVMNVIRNLMDLKDNLPELGILKKYLSVGDQLYHNSSQIDEKICSYESHIQRPYFHVKPLDECQLENWHQYLDFVEMQGDFDWTVKLYERCLIPCANYSEFWIRYVEFVEAKGGREIANHALGRAQKVFFKTVPAFHLYCSMFKEKTGDVNGARAPFLRSDIELDHEFIENVTREANMEKRMGNNESAYMVFEKAIEMAKAKQSLQVLSILYIKFARFTFGVSNDVDAAMEVFMRGIQELPSKSIIQEMINFVILRGGPGQIPKLDSNIANIIDPVLAVSQALNSHDREEISSLFLEFVDLYGTIHEIRKAWNRHRKLFPHIMKPITKYHFTPVSDSHLVKEVVGRKQMFVPGSHQACQNGGHQDSRTHLLNCQSLGENNQFPSEGIITDQLQDNLSDDKGREELVEVAVVVEKHSVNDNKGRVEVEVAEDVEKQSIYDNKEREELVEVTDDVEKQSIHDSKGREELVEVTDDVEKQSINDSKGREELVEVADLEKQSINVNNSREELLEVVEDVKMQSIPEGTELHDVPRVSDQDSQSAAQIPEATQEYPKVENQVRSNPEQSPCDALRSPSLPNMSINYRDNETQQSNPTASRGQNIPQEATSGAGENVLLDEGNSDEVSAIHVSDHIANKPSTPSQVQGNNSPLHSVCDSTPPESRSTPQVEMQASSQTTTQQALPVNVAYSQNASSTGNWTQMYYVQTSQSQPWHVQPQLTPSGATDTQMVVAQGYPYQSQGWTGTLDQKINQTFGQYQMATAQVYPGGNVAWPGQSMQQQACAYVQPQSGQPQPQPQVNQQSVQSNEQLFGYVQNSQGIPPHIWQYYQQQYYYLQQHQQQSQQLQSNSQQDKVGHLQQLNPQQHQQPNKQISSQQLQHSQQNQQSSQQLLQQQLAQYQQQNQQVQDTQQYQQLLYLQQQQQQQLYLQQQQQYYLQQQQLLQQQQFQQLSQQEQHLLLQQQQQLLVQQQQQQFLQLQQQHQQQLQQLQQQPVLPQQQINESDLKALSNSYIQGEGDKLHNSEQSGPSVSPHPNSPSNQ